MSCEILRPRPAPTRARTNGRANAVELNPCELIQRMPRRHGTESYRSPTKAPGSDGQACTSNCLNTIETTTATKSKSTLNRAQLSVDSDDEHPDPEVLAQFLESRTDFVTPYALQREKLWQEKTRLQETFSKLKKTIPMFGFLLQICQTRKRYSETKRRLITYLRLTGVIESIRGDGR